MNFQEAASAHREWNVKLRMYIDGQGELKADHVCLDNQCALGKWIHGDGKKHASIPEYDQLRTIHAQFHQVAADIVKMVDNNQKDQAKNALEAGSKFRELSTKIMTVLGHMEKKAV